MKQSCKLKSVSMVTHILESGFKVPIEERLGERVYFTDNRCGRSECDTSEGIRFCTSIFKIDVGWTI